jgi:ribosome-associated protein
LAAAELAANTRCEEVVLLDLRGKSPVTEYFIIATGTSPRQMRTVVDELEELGEKMGFAAWQTNGYDSARWIVLDCVNVVIHVFDGDSREFYDLELLWGDSPRVDWRKELGLPEESVKVRRPTDEEDGIVGVADDEGDVEAEEEGTVEVEVPDESTGSNSVEFVEAESPIKRGKRGRGAFVTTVEEAEDQTMEEQAMNPVKRVGFGAEDFEEQPKARKKKAKVAGKGAAKKAAGKKSAVKKVVKKVKKAVRKLKAAVKKAGGAKTGKAAKVSAKRKVAAKKKSKR